MIIVKNRELLIPNNERYIGTTYDDKTENRVFQVPRFSQRGVDLAALTFRLDIQYANEAFDTVLLDKEVGEAFIILIWRITSSTLQVPGTLYIGLRAIDDEATVKWSSFSASMYAERHLNTPGNYGGSLTEIEQMEQDFQYMKGVIDDLDQHIAYKSADAEAWARGTREGHPVGSDDETYQNNAKYYSEQADVNGEKWARGTIDGIDVGSEDETYHNNAKYYSELTDHTGERWTRGTIDGVPVPSSDETYQNNAKYYSDLREEATHIAEGLARGTRDGVDIPSGQPGYHDNAKYWNIVSEGWAHGGTGTHENEQTDNSKYWSEISHAYANQVSYKKVYANVAEMVADPELIDGQVVRTLGYNAVNDGGGALYRINTTAQGSESVQLSNGLYAIMTNESHAVYRLSVEKFGGYADGTHEVETEAAINSGLTYAVNHGFNVVYLPDGEYLIRGYNPSAADNRAEVNAGIVPPSNMHIILSKDATIKVAPNKKTRYGAFYLNEKENVVIEGGKIVGDRLNHDYTTVTSSHEWGAGIRLIGCRDCVIQNVEISLFTGDAITMTSNGTYGQADYSPTRNTRVLNCNIHSTRRIGITVSGTENTLVQGCHIHDIGTTIEGTAGIAPKVGMDLEGYGTTDTITVMPFDVTISNNYFSGNESDINMYTVNKCIIIGNHFESVVECGYAYQSIVANNAFYGHGNGRAISTTASRSVMNNQNNLIIKGNMINDYQVGMMLKGNNITACDNTIVNTTDIGIHLSGVLSLTSKNIAVIDNNVINSNEGIRINAVENGTIEGNQIINSVQPLRTYNYVGKMVVIKNNVIDTFTGYLLNIASSSGYTENDVITFENNIVRNCAYVGSGGPISINEDVNVDIIGNVFENIDAQRVITISNNRNATNIGNITISKNVFKNCVRGNSSFLIVHEAQHTPSIMIADNHFYAESSTNPVIYIAYGTQTSRSGIIGNVIIPGKNDTTLSAAIKTQNSGIGLIANNVVMVGTIVSVETDAVVNNYVRQAA